MADKNNSMKKWILIVAILATQMVKAQDTTLIKGIISLKQCVNIAIKNNLDINKTSLNAASERANWQQAKGGMLPYVNGNINHGLSNGRTIDPYTNRYVNQSVTYGNYSLNGTLYLWNGGAIQNNIKGYALCYEASKMDLQQQKDNIIISVILAYLQVLNLDEQLNAARQQVETSRKQVERLAIQNQEGAILPATYYDLKGQLANDELNVITLQNSWVTAKINLAAYLNIPYSSEMELDKSAASTAASLYTDNADAVYEQALNNLALIKSAALRKQSAFFLVKAAKGQQWPALTLGGGLGTNYSNAATLQTLTGTSDVATDNYILLPSNQKLSVFAPQSTYSTHTISYGDQWSNNFNTSLSIGLQIPILNGWQTKTKIAQAKIAARRAELVEKSAKIQVQQNVQQAYSNMQAGYERLSKLESQVMDYSEVFRSADVRFNLGAINSVDYLIAKTNLDKANINLIAAKYDYVFRTKILDYYEGKLSF